MFPTQNTKTTSDVRSVYNKQKKTNFQPSNMLKHAIIIIKYNITHEEDMPERTEKEI